MEQEVGSRKGLAGIGIAVGLVIGTAVGIFVHQLTLGISLGIVFGVGLSRLMNKRQSTTIN